MVLSHWKQLSEDRYTGYKSMDMGINKLNLNIIFISFSKKLNKTRKGDLPITDTIQYLIKVNIWFK